MVVQHRLVLLLLPEASHFDVRRFAGLGLVDFGIEVVFVERFDSCQPCVLAHSCLNFSASLRRRSFPSSIAMISASSTRSMSAFTFAVTFAVNASSCT